MKYLIQSSTEVGRFDSFTDLESVKMYCLNSFRKIVKNDLIFHLILILIVNSDVSACSPL